MLKKILALKDNKKLILQLIQYWPPYLGAGIKVLSTNTDFTRIKVGMNLKPWNKNIMGTHFGGSLYAMTDPFFMFILMHHLGEHYQVWDQAASIYFKKPGRGKVSAEFEISFEHIQQLKASLEHNKVIRPVFKTQILDSQNNIIAEVEKTLYVRKKTTP